MFESRSSPGERVAMETPLPCSPSFESVSDSKKRQEATEQKVCGGERGGGGEKEEKLSVKQQQEGALAADRRFME